jgi:hypothetical protein
MPDQSSFIVSFIVPPCFGYPQYGIPIWRLWPNIRFLPSTVTEKNATKNILDGRTDRGKIVYPPPPSGSGGTHWTYMHIFRHIFLSNYWWQKSDIWPEASYRYPISWEVFLDTSDSYFLFADFVDFYTHWTYILYMPIFSKFEFGAKLISDNF